MAIYSGTLGCATSQSWRRYCNAQKILRAHLPRLLDTIDWQALDKLIKYYFDIHLFPVQTNNKWIAIDGKVLRGTSKSDEKQAIVHAVTQNSGVEVA